MKKTLFLVILILALLLVVAAEGPDAEISWTLPTTYADGTPIDPAAARHIVVMVYSGPSQTGPWALIARSAPGATSATIPAPPFGEKIWYTARSSLQRADSDYAVPVSNTGYYVPKIPPVKKIARKMLTKKKMIFLFLLALLAGLVVTIRYGVKRGKGEPPRITHTRDQ